MRAQASVEFIVYMAAGAASLTVMLASSSIALQNTSNADASNYIGALVAKINANMAYTKSIFTAYLPSSICAAAINHKSIAYLNNTYEFAGTVYFKSNMCNYSGSIRTLELFQNTNGSYTLGMIK
ncbi:MAG: hypothetical protein ACP5TL_01640 [Candidatus Micrarchaeia archaeon]